MIPRGVVLICVLGACGGSSHNAAAVLDSLVPGARIGALAGPVAQRLHLGVQPYGTYGDSSYAPTPRIRGVMLFVDEKFEKSEDRPSQAARIRGVTLGLRSRQDTDSVRTMLTRKLGPPEPSCFKPTDEPIWGELFYWPTGEHEGVLLYGPRDSSRMLAMLMLGREVLANFKSTTPGKCESAP